MDESEHAACGKEQPEVLTSSSLRASKLTLRLDFFFLSFLGLRSSCSSSALLSASSAPLAAGCSAGSATRPVTQRQSWQCMCYGSWWRQSRNMHLGQGCSNGT